MFNGAQSNDTSPVLYNYQPELLVRTCFCGRDISKDCFALQAYLPVTDQLGCALCLGNLLPADASPSTYYCPVCGQVYLLLYYNFTWLAQEFWN